MILDARHAFHVLLGECGQPIMTALLVVEHIDDQSPAIEDQGVAARPVTCLGFADTLLVSRRGAIGHRLGLPTHIVDPADHAIGQFDLAVGLTVVAESRLPGDDAQRIPGDRLMLRRGLSNLLANAIRHTSTGGSVTIRLTLESDHAVIAVENPGTISPEKLPHLFDRFYTGDPARSSGGTGLGLAIVRSIVDVHGGRISASTTAGRTVFEMWLPMKVI